MPASSPGTSQARSGFDQVFGPKELSANTSMKVTSGATTIAASIGDMTSESIGTPTIASPPPKAPLLSDMTKTAESPTR
jgi:hypothetical protein